MERGEIRQFLNTTQPEQPTEPFVEEALSQIAHDLGLEMSKLHERHVFITSQQLQSRHNPGIQSDDRLTIVWCHDEPAALSLETRNVFNNVRTQQVYLGPRQIDDV